MKIKYFFLLPLLFIAAYLLLNAPDSSFAVDHGGCLTCHRYPGLVRLEETGEFKMFHIDEEKHLASAHGKVDCKECHAEVVEIPHTGRTKVECTKACHAEDKEKIATDPASLRAYHKDEIFAITKLEDNSSCRVCHPLYPHSHNNKVRALVNMHTGFMLCEVCHLKKEAPKKLSYEWNKPDVFEFMGEPYGTHEKREKEEEEEKNNGIISKMLKIFSEEESTPEGGKKTEYLISRIAPFSLIKGKKELLMNTKDNDRAREFLEKEKTLGPAQKEKELEFFHRDIAKKEISVACNECHSSGGILDFRKLGFDDKRAKDLEYMNIKSLLTKYETFVIPNLFGPK